jgi:hypothetical protein
VHHRDFQVRVGFCKKSEGDRKGLNWKIDIAPLDSYLSINLGLLPPNEL